MTSCLFGDKTADPAVIDDLASQDRSVEDVDVCEAIEDMGLEDELEEILGAGEVSLRSEYTYDEYSLTQGCYVTTGPEDEQSPQLALFLSQGGDLDDRVGE